MRLEANPAAETGCTPGEVVGASDSEDSSCGGERDFGIPDIKSATLDWSSKSYSSERDGGSEQAREFHGRKLESKSGN